MNLSRRNFCKTLALASATGLGACASPYGSKSSYISQIIHPKNHNTVFHWLDVLLQQIREQRTPPPRAAVVLAMPLTAGFLAANGLERRYQEHFRLPEGPFEGLSRVAYAAAFTTAAADLMETPFLAETSEFYKGFPDGVAKDNAIAWGRHVGQHLLRLRVDDGSEPSEVNYYLGRYKRQQGPIKWSPTGPFYSAKPGPAFGSFARGLFPGQGKITPWTMRSSDQFRAKPFYDVRGLEFAQEYQYIKAIGGKDSTMRTKEQEEIALFWEDGPWGITPPGHFLQIAMQVLQHKHMSFIELARAFALLGMTQCDASISAWDSKYHYDIIRPETAIRSRASEFKNRYQHLRPQSNWQSYLPTPEFPSYTSGHSTFGSAGTKMIELLNGSDRISISGGPPDQVIWPQIKGVTRHWTSLSQINDENGMSRIYGGVHWQLDHTEAVRAGYGIAEQAFHNLFPERAM